MRRRSTRSTVRVRVPLRTQPPIVVGKAFARKNSKRRALPKSMVEQSALTEGLRVLVSKYRKSFVQGVCDVNSCNDMGTIIRLVTHIFQLVVCCIPFNAVKRHLINDMHLKKIAHSELVCITYIEASSAKCASTSIRDMRL